MLVPEVNLQVEHPLSVALEAEVTRFDYAGMHRSDGDLVDARSADLEERVGRIVFTTTGLSELGMAAQCFQPGVTLGTNPVLLEELTLEGLGLRERRRHRRYAAGARDLSSNESDLAAVVPGERHEDFEVPAVRGGNGATSRDPCAGETEIYASLVKLPWRHQRDVGKLDGETVRSPSDGFEPASHFFLRPDVTLSPRAPTDSLPL